MTQIQTQDLVVRLGLALTLCLTLLCPAIDSTQPELLKMQFMSRNIRDTDCQINCTNSKRRYVCGTDGVTYTSKCEVKKARRCDGKSVTVQSVGRCREISGGRTSSKCLVDRQQTLELARRPSSGVYVPECSKDGTFAEVQCHAATNYCWCVTADGLPIPGSSVEGKKKITCSGRKGKKHRRSDGTGKHRRGSNGKGCSQTDRSTFNGNLIKHFSQEYERAPKPTQPPNAKSSNDSQEKLVIEWKFSELDKDNDGKLKKRELRALKRIVRKVVVPKECAKDFDKHCDLNSNSRIERNEWSACLVDIKNELASTTGSSDGRNNRGGIPLRTSADPNHHTLLALIGRKGISQPRLWPGTVNTRPVSDSTASSRDIKRELPTARSCAEERKNAEDLDRDTPEGRIFIPECKNNELYKNAQCHTATGYCWCVNEKTGKPIAGTSTFRVTPECNTVAKKTIKGCPYQEKKVFLTELLDSLVTQMAAYVNNGSDSRNNREPNPAYSIEERAVRWKLRMLDKNRNSILEKGEYKKFKKELKGMKKKKKSIRKCARNFMRFCDSNSDSKVTLEEWIDCMGVQEKQRNLPPNPRRKGPNPFRKWLKS